MRTFIAGDDGLCGLDLRRGDVHVPYPFGDGAQIYLVTGVMLDRTGAEYPDSVAPDEAILSEAALRITTP
jgi:hypothetical protein